MNDNDESRTITRDALQNLVWGAVSGGALLLLFLYILILVGGMQPHASELGVLKARMNTLERAMERIEDKVEILRERSP